MLIYRIYLIVFSLSMPMVTLVVGGRLVWCTYQLVRISRYRLAALSALAGVLLGGLLLVVGFYWFRWDTAQTGKEIWTQLRLDILTVVPFWGASFALWRLGGSLQAVVRYHSWST